MRIVFLLGFYVFTHLQGWSITRYVATTGTDTGDCSAGNCLTINYAIGQAVDGDVIEVAAGTYNESILINKSITLRGVFAGVNATDVSRGIGESIIFRPASNLTTGILITIQATDVVIDGFTLNGNQEYVQGIFINGVSNTTIQNNIIRKFNTTNTNPATQLEPAGIYGTGTATNHLIQNNLIENIRNPTYSFFTLTPNIDPSTLVTGAGIRVRSNFDATITQNTLDSTSIGIEISNYSMAGSGGNVTNNQINGLNNIPVYQGITLRNLTNGTWNVANNTLSFAQAYFTVTNFGFNINVPNSAINIAQISTPITIQNNDVNGSYYGFNLYDIATSAALTLQNGTISQTTIGISCNNGSGTYANSTFTLDGITIHDFPVTFPIAGGSQFQAGVYLFAASASTTQTISANIQNCIIQGTVNNTSSNSAGLYAHNAHASNYLINLTVSDSDISNHANRGIYLRRVNNSSFARCDINNNGFDGYNNGSFIDGLGVYMNQASNNIIFTECNLINNTGATTSVRLENNATCTIHRCAVIGTDLVQNLESQPINASGCWWGSATLPTDFWVPTQMDFTPWLNVGTDTDAATRGFQGDFSYLHVGRNTGEGIQMGSTGRVQEAHDLAEEGATLYLRDNTVIYPEIWTVSKNLTMANPSTATIQALTMNGNGRILTLANDLQISNNLTLTDGIISTNANILWVTNNALAAVSSTATSWVNGYLRRNINTSLMNFYEFPIGSSTNAEKAEVQLNNTSGGLIYLTTRFVPQNPYSNPAPDTYTLTDFTENSILYNALLTQGYWEITPNIGTNSSDYDLRLFPSFNVASSVIVKRELPATVWQQEGIPLTVTGGVGREEFNGFSNFAIATNNVALASYFKNFEASYWKENKVQIQWTLQSNETIHLVELQRSTNLTHFKTIASLFHPDLSYQLIDTLNVNNSNTVFYRIQLKTQSGTTHFSKIIAIDLKESILNWNIFPNPSQGDIFIQTNSDKTTDVLLMNLEGNVLEKIKLATSNSKLNLRHLPSGIYMLKLINADAVQYKRIVID